MEPEEALYAELAGAMTPQVMQKLYTFLVRLDPLLYDIATRGRVSMGVEYPVEPERNITSELEVFEAIVEKLTQRVMHAHMIVSATIAAGK